MRSLSTGIVHTDGVRRYWGTAEDKARCIVGTTDWGAPQCSRKRGQGPDGLYCSQHARLVSPPQSEEAKA